MVVDLMELYLHRLKQTRPPYPKNPAMADFAAQFPYEPTPDQKQAFIDVERDLTERESPMDRLICGDVGFGIRAIFCLVSAGTQAMVLAPTIVLAKQHFDVISERFSVYPNINVGLLSRFQTKAEKEEYLDMIKQGHLNIIVGTHSLLGSRVVYNNLGLLVVDEEQRFGVKQKEKIASFKTSVDVLTLSATPIPQTLYLALTGFHDASLISTPPPERVPIKTHLSAFSKEKVISAVKNELDRDGQVFYVLPRIKGLEEVMDFLEQAFPNVDIAIAHGQQYSKQLEETMEKFSQRVIKILICTNIVESGLDIQNANAIIVQDVQQFGLAQLYQLRGRVGLADKEAHAHLFYPDKSLLSDEALSIRYPGCVYRKGLQLFKNAMNLVKSGDVGNVGIDLFFEMLFESLSKVDEHLVITVPYLVCAVFGIFTQTICPSVVTIDINVNPRLPSEYINYLENPMEIISETENAAENADLGIIRIYASGKMVGTETNMNKRVFKLMTDSMTSDIYRNSLVFDRDQIKAELLLELPKEQLLNWIFQCLGELHASLPALIKY
ncbi:hypothetical protein Pint_07264 [Pistacia integerrima]|uniref:Uncharacterized protein n=1 Tax=Pistacia integerrima TaxID=434235 RepID=A0ACC0XW44_9ROSI|nr:hypothetical protein Pint_07264 [Pistacia integerrima]